MLPWQILEPSVPRYKAPGFNGSGKMPMASLTGQISRLRSFSKAPSFSLNRSPVSREIYVCRASILSEDQPARRQLRPAAARHVLAVKRVDDLHPFDIIAIVTQPGACFKCKFRTRAEMAKIPGGSSLAIVASDPEIGKDAKIGGTGKPYRTLAARKWSLRSESSSAA